MGDDRGSAIAILWSLRCGMYSCSDWLARRRMRRRRRRGSRMRRVRRIWEGRCSERCRGYAAPKRAGR